MEKTWSGQGLDMLMEEIWKLKACGSTQLKILLYQKNKKVFLFINVNDKTSEYSKNSFLRCKNCIFTIDSYKFQVSRMKK